MTCVSSTRAYIYHLPCRLRQSIGLQSAHITVTITIVLILVVSQSIRRDQPPRIRPSISSVRRPLLGEFRAPRNGIVVQHQLELLHLVEHLDPRKPAQLPRLDVPAPDLAQRQRPRGRKSAIEEPARERGEIGVCLRAWERHAAGLSADEPCINIISLRGCTG